ncbi:hypothetical protein DICSQDRAFT_47591 [Dichomitus squalens LYAD-421 SS1]|uniref:uncharacterized protein n=1 Tax=Dichomitus squalens (strain LYAD-421) TaxID=732165 RepID=UPI00044122E0|nr:uncharacterized protein DICSQDRAFT_47591 [Dichomitus squalens LYAD-421 SS1]EJF67162.1 hypothetical protein DICSQDRAFT_47591 [Dichomitus squalens LYAD-421 SS1]
MAEPRRDSNVDKAKIDDQPRSPEHSGPAAPETQSSTEDSAYPPQRHAGAVGYGPEYGKGAGTSDKLQGFQEEVKGKVLRKPDLVQHGHEMRTGQLKKKQLQDDFGGDGGPFAKAGGKDDEEDATSSDSKQEVQAATTAPEGTDKADRQQQGQNTDKTNYMGSS